jgi:hypothetical protein
VTPELMILLSFNTTPGMAPCGVAKAAREETVA